jgi:hypothetical protein
LAKGDAEDKRLFICVGRKNRKGISGLFAPSCSRRVRFDVAQVKIVAAGYRIWVFNKDGGVELELVAGQISQLSGELISALVDVVNNLVQQASGGSEFDIEGFHESCCHAP